MLRWLKASGGHLTKWSASCTVTRPVRPLLRLSSRSHLLPQQGIRYNGDWTKRAIRYPPSAEEKRTVYNACVQSRVFAPGASLPKQLARKTPSGRPEPIRTKVVEDKFKKTPGLQPRDWEAKGVTFSRAAEIALQLHLDQELPGAKKVKDLARNRSEFQKKAEAEKTHSRMATTSKDLLEGSPAKTAAIEEENLDEWVALKARLAFRMRKKAEQDSDAAEGIKSKRRPLRVPATWKGKPLVFDSTERLRRVERHGREVIVDKQVKRWTKGASVDRELVQSKRDKPVREGGMRNRHLLDHEHDSSHERRGTSGLDEARKMDETLPKRERPVRQDNTRSRSLPDHDHDAPKQELRSASALAKIKALALQPPETLRAIIEKKQRTVNDETETANRKSNALRQLQRAKQALAMREWEERQLQWKSRRPDRKA